MTIVIDTGVLLGFLHQGDAHHQEAVQLMERITQGEHGTPVSCEHVLDEAMTLVRRKPGRLADARVLAAYFGYLGGEHGLGPPLLQPVNTPEKVVDRALDRFLGRFERGLSFTDCILIELAHHLDAVIATFDEGFEGQIGTVRG